MDEAAEPNLVQPPRITVSMTSSSPPRQIVSGHSPAFPDPANVNHAVNLVVVLGMHRCGTSAIARGLIELGVDLGENLMEAVNAYNDKGFWENLDVVGLNERLLGVLGSSWDSLAPITEWRSKDPEVRGLRSIAVNIVSQASRQSRPFGFKDPRTTRLLPFWGDVFRDAGLSPGYVIALRNPLSVAASLRNRDYFSPEKSSLLWLQHLLAAISDTTGHSRVIVDYDRLLENPPREIARIADALGWRKPSAEKIAQSIYVRRFLTSSMRHAHHSPQSLSEERAFGGIVQRTYDILLQVADGSLSVDDLPGTLDWQRIESSWADLSRFLPYVSDQDQRLRHALVSARGTREAKAQQEEAYKAFEVNLRQREKALQASQTETQEREIRLAIVENELEVARTRIASLTDSRSWRVTAPLRTISDSLTRTKSRLGGTIREIYASLPLPIETKLQLKSFVFSMLSPLLRDTKAYQAWVAFEKLAQKTNPVTEVRSNEPTVEPFTKQIPGTQGLLPELLGPVLRAPVGNGETLGAQLARLPETPKPCRDKRRLLMVDLWIPTPDRSSGSARLYELLKFMHQIGCSVDLLLHYQKAAHSAINLSASDLERYEEALRQIGVRLIYGAEQGLAELVTAGYRYGIVWLNFPEVAYEYLPWIRAHAVNAHVIFDSIDLHHLRFAREAEILGDPKLLELAAHYRRIEHVCASCADVTVAITERERALLMELAPESHVEVVPNVHEITTHVPAYSERKHLFFIGGFSHRPNVDAVLYFATEVFPSIRREIPDIEFLIVGSNMPDSIRALDGSGIRAIGYVEDPSPYFHTSRLFVVPLRYGAGMKGKLGQALSYGLPSVTTTIGAEGMHLEHGQHALIADTPDAFASAVLSLYRNPILWAQLSTNGLNHLDRLFSPRSVKHKLKSLLSGSSSRLRLFPEGLIQGEGHNDLGQSR